MVARITRHGSVNTGDGITSAGWEIVETRSRAPRQCRQLRTALDARCRRPLCICSRFWAFSVARVIPDLEMGETGSEELDRGSGCRVRARCRRCFVSSAASAGVGCLPFGAPGMFLESVGARNYDAAGRSAACRDEERRPSVNGLCARADPLCDWPRIAHCTTRSCGQRCSVRFHRSCRGCCPAGVLDERVLCQSVAVGVVLGYKGLSRLFKGAMKRSLSWDE